jgi:hypothetical protein
MSDSEPVAPAPAPDGDGAATAEAAELATKQWQELVAKYHASGAMSTPFMGGGMGGVPFPMSFPSAVRPSLAIAGQPHPPCARPAPALTSQSCVNSRRLLCCPR